MEDDAGKGVLGLSALARNAEFFFEIVFDVPDDGDGLFHFNATLPLCFFSIIGNFFHFVNEKIQKKLKSIGRWEGCENR